MVLWSCHSHGARKDMHNHYQSGSEFPQLVDGWHFIVKISTIWQQYDVKNSALLHHILLTYTPSPLPHRSSWCSCQHRMMWTCPAGCCTSNVVVKPSFSKSKNTTVLLLLSVCNCSHNISNLLSKEQTLARRVDEMVGQLGLAFSLMWHRHSSLAPVSLHLCKVWLAVWSWDYKQCVLCYWQRRSPS